MIEKIVLQNMSTLEQVSCGQDVSNEYLIPEGGIDWGTVNASHNTYGYPGQAGVYISSTSLRPRDISITGYAFYILSDADKSIVPETDWLEYCYSRILDKKSVIDSIVNPDDYLRIIVGDYYIEGKPNNSVIFGKTVRDNNKYFCKFTISLYCNNPLFHRVSERQVVLSSVIPSFHFPLRFPKNKGIVMSVRRGYQLIAVENDGAIPVGCVIHLTSRGSIVNPTIENVLTGEKISISKTMSQGEEITINTNDGNEKGIYGTIDGISESYFKYWNFDNSWIKVPVGASLFGYSVESGNESLLDVSIDISPAKHTLEEL